MNNDADEFWRREFWETMFMSESLKKKFGLKVITKDGIVKGKIYDFCFDDQSWVIRYLVVSTGCFPWAPKILIAPDYYSISVHVSASKFSVNLSEKEIESSKEIEDDKPVYLQHKKNYYLPEPCGHPETGMFCNPILLANISDSKTNADDKKFNKHLRSVREIIGYEAYGLNGKIGKVKDFMADNDLKTITNILVSFKSFFSDMGLIFPLQQVEKISWEEKKMYLSKEK
jgi:sporulation protein YlmC with PRC-barrel domain